MGTNSLNIKLNSSLDWEVPKLIEIKNHNFNKVHSEWIKGDSLKVELDGGVYVVIVKLSSTDKIKKVVNLKGS